jgi:hypothetical protein
MIFLAILLIIVENKYKLYVNLSEYSVVGLRIIFRNDRE